MSSISISQLKINPAKAIKEASDFPLAVENRNKVEAYLVGRDLYEKIVSYIEDFIDKKAIKDTNFSKGRDFEAVASELKL